LPSPLTSTLSLFPPISLSPATHANPEAAIRDSSLAAWRVSNAARQSALDSSLSGLLASIDKGADEGKKRVAAMEEAIAENPALSGEVPCGDVSRKLATAMNDGAGMEAVQELAMGLRGCMREQIAKGV